MPNHLSITLPKLNYVLYLRCKYHKLTSNIEPITVTRSSEPCIQENKGNVSSKLTSNESY